MSILQESTSATWDLRYIYREPTTEFKIYTLFLFTVCIIVFIRLLGVWSVASKGMKKQNSSEFLQKSTSSLDRWMIFTAIGWAISTSINVNEICDRLLDARNVTRFIVLYGIQEVSTVLIMALLVLLFAFVVRCVIIKRIEQLRNSP